ncbi:GNAT family N-acetyltransferase [Natranaerofaba carboxydovora]|uniref:GNAT family N-acetyltransferase n=1 Tax=Natranaerofaba carboxydovora TaxID=2742683 RepID=UPI001F13EC5C|nr:GNAT family N-acetyltransferase [Natranaerofaba carboxydovora]UMZ74375.1 Phosphinothricin N-acetyltransferase [Natranaerofaba carboxydovora]
MPKNISEEVKFEEIKERHLKEVLEIYNYYVLNTTATLHINSLSIDDMRELVFFTDPKYKTFVITKANKICGFVMIAQYKNREAYDKTGEVSIYLKPELIGQGLGSKGIKYIEDYAKTKSFHALIATICGNNQKSVDMFERNEYIKRAHYKEIGKKAGRYLDVVAYQKII